jgi:chromosome segregation ATPase
MLSLLIACCAVFVVVLTLLLVRIARLKQQLKRFAGVSDVEAHLEQCQFAASEAEAQRMAAVGQTEAAQQHLAFTHQQIAHYQSVLGPVKAAADLQTQIQHDTAKAKQLAAALGKFENALQLKQYLESQQAQVQATQQHLESLQQQVGASLTLIELKERIETSTVQAKNLASTLSGLKRASELKDYLQKQEQSIQQCQATLDSMREAIGAARTVVELKQRIDQHQAKIQQMAQTIGGLERVHQLAAYIQRQEQAIQQNNQTLAEFSTALGNARSAAEIAAQVAYYQNYLAVLQAEVNTVEEAKGLQEFGFYRARYDFGTAVEYEEELDRIRDQQKRMLNNKTACACTSEWTVNGDKREGKKMTDKQVKLMLRAFNGESDAAVGKARYNNVVTLEKRIQKAFEAINKLGETQMTFISPEFCRLKIEELHLAYEFQKKKEEEREVQKAMKEQLKEEERVAKELERACEEAEREEELKTIALERARLELEKKHGEHNAKLESLVSRLENELKEALDRKAKAIARAQLTKSGHVYILSNIGTFGEDVFKIGMSRRLEPLERVAELGGASVPFPFDVHAMIYCEDAPALENMLHKRFADRRVNMINLRREFFRVSLDEIRAAVAECHGHVTFLTIPEAAQYRETLALLKDREREAKPLLIA